MIRRFPSNNLSKSILLFDSYVRILLFDSYVSSRWYFQADVLQKDISSILADEKRFESYRLL
jgi:hypothetical protein